MTFNFTWTIYTYLLGLAIGFKLYECLLDEKKYSFKIWFHGAKCFIYWGYNFKAYNMIL